jgi:exodeoxyribonuclease VII small subunit
MSDPQPITFEDGYRRLQEITEKVNQAEVSVDRMTDLFAEGKGLDGAVTNHLAEQKARIERIERGEEVQAFRVVSPPDEGERSSRASTGALEPAPIRSADDDIPF